MTRYALTYRRVQTTIEVQEILRCKMVYTNMFFGAGKNAYHDFFII